MPSLTTQYVYFGSSGPHTRQPRAVTSYGGFTPIPNLNPSGTATLATGTPYQTGLMDQTVTEDGVTYTFGFTTVSGCTEGPRTSFVSSTPPAVGTVGTSPISVLVVYLPTTSSTGNGDSGAVIDAFDETTGMLVDNNFVVVTPDDASDTITDTANVDGWVDTQDSAYTITADHPNIGPYGTAPTNELFDQWVVLTDPSPPSTLVSGAKLTPGKGETVYALAFYKVPVSIKIHKEVLPEKFLKEFIKEKELDKLHKENILEGKSVVIDLPKGPKETFENPGFGGTGVDPGPGAIGAGEIRALGQRVARLEAAAKAATKGKAFIKPADRPPVGTAKQRKVRDR